MEHIQARISYDKNFKKQEKNYKYNINNNGDNWIYPIK